MSVEEPRLGGKGGGFGFKGGETSVVVVLADTGLTSASDCD